jgi:UDP-N-acetylmuramoyl-tripeptide--D-alanyl-D-alanine ligase
MLKKYIQKKLEKYAKNYFIEHPEVKLVAVAGSISKSSTKVAIATVLSETFRVRMNEHDLNNDLSVPLSILGIDYPDNTKSLLSWIDVILAAKKRVNDPTDVDVIVQELGINRIGQMSHFSQYLNPDIGVITAVSLEHIEFFQTIDAVAKEELALANFSKIALINRDDIDGDYSKYITNAKLDSYGTNAAAEYYFISQKYSIEDGNVGELTAPELSEKISANIHVIGEHTLRPAVAAGAVAVKLGMSVADISKGLQKIRPIPGCMNPLRGIEESIIIDDTYNSNPLSADSSLRALYQIDSPQRIAVLGSMNELGDISELEHKKLGELCNPSELAWVITVGYMAEKFLATAAEARGCKIKCFRNSALAGKFVKGIIEQGAVILFKGSEGNIFLEEAVKEVLLSSDDESKLVRQSVAWLAKKTEFFKKSRGKIK